MEKHSSLLEMYGGSNPSGASNFLNRDFMMDKITQFNQAIESPLFGFFLLGDQASFPLILSGEFDITIKASLYYKEFNKKPESLEELNSNTLISDYLEKLKNVIREKIKLSVYQHTQKEKNRKSGGAIKMQELNKTSEFGTIAEIAEKYNLTKSKVRRMKKDGTLADFINKNN